MTVLQTITSFALPAAGAGVGAAAGLYLSWDSLRAIVAGWSKVATLEELKNWHAYFDWQNITTVPLNATIVLWNEPLKMACTGWWDPDYQGFVMDNHQIWYVADCTYWMNCAPPDEGRSPA